MEPQQLPLKDKMLTPRNVGILSVAGVMAIICLVMLFSPSADGREDEWMRVMELTDEQVLNNGEISACESTIESLSTRNSEIASEKEQIKNSLWDFQAGTR